MRILWLDAFHGGSHAAVAQGYARHSRHHVTLLTLPIDGGWRWRMRGAALSFARMLREQPELAAADLIVATDMLDLATFLGLVRDLVPHTPVALYLHENQLTYPLPAGRKRDLSFPWVNYTAMLAADALLFNSAFHRDILLGSLRGLPSRFHDYQELQLLDTLRPKAHVLYPGLDLARFDADPPDAPRTTGLPTILWNSRWEYDKNPEAFFEALQQLVQRGDEFSLIVAGEHIDPAEPNFAAAREWAAPYCQWWGYARNPADYRALLRRSDIVVSTADQEFFGIAVLEAMYAGCMPILPRRLSYPELIPPEAHAACLYETPEELVAKLSHALQRSTPPPLDMRAIAGQFRWEQQAPRYDALLEGLLT